MSAEAGTRRGTPAIPVAPGYVVELVRAWQITCEGCGVFTTVNGPHAAIHATAFYADHARGCGT